MWVVSTLRSGHPTTAARRPPTIETSAFDAVLFDLDGVITDTAALHRDAWARLALECLSGHLLSQDEYLSLIDGKRREDGVRSLLAAHRVTAGPARVQELAATKDRYFQELLAERGPGVISTSVDLVRRSRRDGLRCAVVTASRNCDRILRSGGLVGLFDAQVDGLTIEELALPGKPDPASFQEAARRLGVPARRAVVVEDSQAGVEAGHRGGFGLVIALDRSGEREGLLDAGADVLVADLAAVQVTGGP